MPGSGPGEYVRLTVKDAGPGLSDDRLYEIFDRDATVRPAVVDAQDLMLRLGGFVRVESAEGVGTAVHLYFGRIASAGEGDHEPCSGRTGGSGLTTAQSRRCAGSSATIQAGR
jgi:hypothetical protein